MSSVPAQGYPTVSLADAVEPDAPIIYGILQPGPEQMVGVPYIRPTEIVGDSVDVSAVRRTTVEIANKYKRATLRADDVVLSIVGTIGKVALVPPELDGANITQSSARLRARRGTVDPKYLAAFLRSPAARAQYADLTLGTGVPRLNLADVREVAMPLPPIDDQRRIVAHLDACFERTKRAKKALDEVPALLDRLRQSILAAAFRGDLTADWRAENPDVEPASELLKRIRVERRRRWEEAELAKMIAKGKPPKDDRWKAKYMEPEPVDESELPELPEGWCWAGLSELAGLQLGQRRAPEFQHESPRPYIRAANITWRGLDLTDVKSMGIADPASVSLEPGDVLLNEASGSPTEVGKAAVWRGEIDGCCFQATVLRVRSHAPSLVSGDWIHQCMLADARLGRFAAMAPGVGILHLTAERLRSWPVPVAPAAEQEALVARLSAASVRVDALATLSEQVKGRAGSLDASLLAAAFARP